MNEQSSSVAIQVAQVEDQLQKSRICAPIQGTVLAKYTEPGEYTAPGKPLFKIADTEHMFLRAYITSSQLSQVAIGQSVRLYADFGDDNRKEYPGTICWIVEKAREFQKNIYVCFIDYAKAFDCADHNKLWKILTFSMIPPMLAIWPLVPLPFLKPA